MNPREVEQKLIIENELQNHLEDGWRCVGVLSNGEIVVERSYCTAAGFVDTIRRMVERFEIERRLDEGWSLATVRTVLVLPSGRFVVERPKL